MNKAYATGTIYYEQQFNQAENYYFDVEKTGDGKLEVKKRSIDTSMFTKYVVSPLVHSLIGYHLIPLLRNVRNIYK